jgi:hypothetical protein
MKLAEALALRYGNLKTLVSAASDGVRRELGVQRVPRSLLREYLLDALCLRKVRMLARERLSRIELPHTMLTLVNVS